MHYENFNKNNNVISCLRYEQSGFLVIIFGPVYLQKRPASSKTNKYKQNKEGSYIFCRFLLNRQRYIMALLGAII